MNITINKNSVVINKIDIALSRIKERMRTTNTNNRTLLGRYIKNLSKAKKLLIDDKLNDFNNNKLKIALVGLINAADSDISMMR